jgi:epoxyqueuosine reductase
MSQPLAPAAASLLPAQRTARAKVLAAENGFSLCGIAAVPADGSAPHSQNFTKWLDRGNQGPLDYLVSNRQTRIQLHSRFPWVRTVLALGSFYDGVERGERGRDLSAHVARYARGRDYHRIFEKRLKKLGAALIAEGLCSRAHRYVDTGPVLERAWAEAASIGWIGKNTCVIHPRLGSYFLLAEILLDSELEPDAPALNHCGTCTRCIQACPTQAITSPNVLDARRCLVTWNLELKGDTPRELWPQQGEWAAGCDICQSVCPYNAPRRIAPADPELAAPLPWQSMTLAQSIVMNEEQFDRAFEASALRRTGVKGLRLGAITAAGNVKANECRDALNECLRDPDVDIRARAEWALAQLA